MLPILIVVCILLILYYLWCSTSKPPNFPPGPPRRPLLLLMLSRPKSMFHGVSENVVKFGKVFGFFLGTTPVVMVADYEVLKELFKREEVTSRPPIRPMNELRIGHELPELNGSPPGLVFSSGKYWRDQRRFVLRHLRDFGFGKASMEGMIMAEVEKLCQMAQKKTGKPLSLNQTLNVSIINALWSILVGDSFELNDPKLNKIVKLMTTAFGNNRAIVVSNLLPHPNMVKWPLIRMISGYESLKNMMGEINDFITPYIKEHRRTLEKDNPRDMMDLIINETENATDPESSFYGPLKADAALYNIFLDMFIAGMETTSSSLEWTFLYMVHHPDVQRKVHQELDKVVGRDRLPSLTDQDDLHYINAVLHESLRISGLAFNGLPHYTNAEIDVQGYTVPKGTIVYGCLYAIMHDPDHFEHPERFNPDRFLDPKTGKFTPDERVIPFGTGKRFCMGQTLAEKEFYLFFVGIMQAFEMLCPEGAKLPGYGELDTNPVGIARQPPKYEVVLKSRVEA